MEKINSLVKNAEKKEFVQFSDNLKEIFAEKMKNHPSMVKHNDQVNKYDEQQRIYAQVTKVTDPEVEDPENIVE